MFSAKRGQLLGQPLLFVFALVVGALILVWGGSVVYDLVKTADCADIYDSMKNFEVTVNSFYNYDEGSSKTMALKYPKSVKYICFFNPEESWNANCKLDGEDCEPEELGEGFRLLLEAKTGSNFFVLPLDVCDNTRIEIKHMKPENANPLCVSNGQPITITTRKDYVAVEYA